jgi:hypothetical protein
MSSKKINLFQYEKGRILEEPNYHTLDDVITINNLSKEESKRIWKNMGETIESNGNIKGLETIVCPFCLMMEFGCSGCQYTGSRTICYKNDFTNINKISYKWYKETYKIINSLFK